MKLKHSTEFHVELAKDEESFRVMMEFYEGSQVLPEAPGLPEETVYLYTCRCGSTLSCNYEPTPTQMIEAIQRNIDKRAIEAFANSLRRTR